MYKHLSSSNFDDVGRFHRKFGLPSVSHEGVGPRNPDPEVIKFRVDFMQEELNEYAEAIAEGDDAKAFDALLDLVYVAEGTAHFHGFPWQEGWDEVQKANMAKVRAQADGSDSARNSSWDVVKPLGWQPPDMDRILFDRGWFAEVGEGAGVEDFERNFDTLTGFTASSAGMPEEIHVEVEG